MSLEASRPAPDRPGRSGDGFSELSEIPRAECAVQQDHSTFLCPDREIGPVATRSRETLDRLAFAFEKAA